jgi:hypothetical protein
MACFPGITCTRSRSTEKRRNLILGGELSRVSKLTSERGYLAVLVNADEIRAKTRRRETALLTI